MDPSGDIALQQRNLLIESTGLMLLIIVPVIALTLLFARRYRASNTEAVYDPEWHHSTQLEVAIWSAPLAIIIALGAITWLSTHTLDPYRALSRADRTQTPAQAAKPLNVDVVALDWKWLFFYPDIGIASVNELAAPVDVPISFKITSATVMNSFFIPAMAGQVYAMAGMQTQLHAIMNHPGDYNGFSANYSGAGFSRMNFTFHALPAQAFDQWVAKAKGQGKALNRAGYDQLQRPSEQAPVQYFSSVETGLFEAILNMCAQPGKMCMDEMNRIDASGGGGRESQENKERLRYDSIRVEQGEEPSGATYPATGTPARSMSVPEGTKPMQMAPNVTPRSALPNAQPDVPGNPAPVQLNERTQ